MSEHLLAKLSQGLERHTYPDPNSGCWLWGGTTHQFGYGSIGVWESGRVKTYGAHRASWWLHRGPIPPRMSVCHRCDTPQCVNPDHLFLGSQLENLRDMFAKGRHPRHGQKLSPEQVRAIRADTRPYTVIAGEFGVSAAAVCLLRQRRTYANVT
jgi:hypothetical protein